MIVTSAKKGDAPFALGIFSTLLHAQSHHFGEKFCALHPCSSLDYGFVVTEGIILTFGLTSGILVSIHLLKHFSPSSRLLLKLKRQYFLKEAPLTLALLSDVYYLLFAFLPWVNYKPCYKVLPFLRRQTSYTISSMYSTLQPGDLRTKSSFLF